MNKNILTRIKKAGKDSVRQIDDSKVLQLDVDFICYWVVDFDATLDIMYKRLCNKITELRKAAGAGYVNAHITMGDKTGRSEMAFTVRYQQSRPPTERGEIVKQLRYMLSTKYGPERCRVVQSKHFEADDVMVRMQHERIKKYGWESSIIMSGDKDLWMGQGLHCNIDNYEIRMHKGYGEVFYKDVGNKEPKLIGTGRGWFWHQMIMGDTADDIPALGRICNSMLDKYTPLKSRKPRKSGTASCGEKKAVIVLDGVTTDKEAARRVWELYQATHKAMARDVFIEQAYLLWMQRGTDVYDIFKYLDKNCNMMFTPNKREMTILDKLQELSDNEVLVSYQ